jgi:hypothetical protein
MEPIPTPTITVSFAIDLELKYDSFKGRSPMEFAILIEDSLQDLLMEVHPDVVSTYTSITAVN